MSKMKVAEEMYVSGYHRCPACGNKLIHNSIGRDQEYVENFYIRSIYVQELSAEKLPRVVHFEFICKRCGYKWTEDREEI